MFRQRLVERTLCALGERLAQKFECCLEASRLLRQRLDRYGRQVGSQQASGRIRLRWTLRGRGVNGLPCRANRG